MQSNLQFYQILHYYTNTAESKRLTRIESELELVRTRDILRRWLPEPPASVLEIGGGPAVHSHWLVECGYLVHLVDIVPTHIELAQTLDKQQKHKLQRSEKTSICMIEKIW